MQNPLSHVLNKNLLFSVFYWLIFFNECYNFIWGEEWWSGVGWHIQPDDPN